MNIQHRTPKRVARFQNLRRLTFDVRRWMFVFSLVFLSSCRSLPPLAPADAARIPVDYAAVLPVSFTAQQTMVFEFKPHWWWPTIRMTALGYAMVNRKTGDYAVVCLSPLGVKVFDVARSNGVVATHTMFSVRGEDQAAAGKAISDDISNLYFNLVPGADAVLKQKGHRLVFRGDRIELEFDGGTGWLVRKKVWNQDVLSTLTFGDYRTRNGVSYPAMMTLENSRYRLILRTVTLEPRRLQSEGAR